MNATGAGLPPMPYQDGQLIDARLHLFDRQVLDRSKVPVTAVDEIEIDDIEFDTPLDADAAAPVIRNLLTGPVLGTRIFGGRPPDSRWIRIPWTDVAEVGIVISLGVDGEGLDATWTERWVRDHIIGRIPGGRHDPR